MYIPKYFQESEFKACVPSCSMSDMSPDLLYYLDAIRACCGFPLYLTSAYRSVEYEKKKGRAGTSSHCKGLAVDIICTDSVKRAKLIGIICEKADLCKEYPVRIGIGKTFLHIDIDMDKPSCIWLY